MNEVKKRLSDFFELITSEKFFFYYIILVMLSLPVTEILDENHSHPFASQPIIIQIAGYIGIFAFIVHFLKHQDIKYYLSDLLYLLLFAFALLSALFTQNKNATWFGFDYDEWLSNFMGYFSLMLAGTMIKQKQLRKNILVVFVIVTLIQVTVAAMQTFGIHLIDCYYDDGYITAQNISYGLIQHSNWYGGLSVLMFACTAGIYLYTANKFIRNSMYILSMFCFYTLISAEARLAWVGTFGFIVFMIFSMMVMKHMGYDKKKLSSILKRFLLLMAGMAAVIATCILVFERITWKIELTSNELNSDIDKLGSRRVVIWKQGLKAVPKYWAFGIGLDNYRDVFYKDPDYHDTFTQGKGHNEYLHYLVTQGVFQFITYMTLLVYAAKTAVRNVIHNDDSEERFINWILLGMFFGYAAQAFFNSSIVNVVPYFWITIGMCLTQKNQHYFGYSRKNKTVSAKK
ncbi:O-antigen ligase family protein [Ruminococcus flavefaciens]|uniref:O-antigen ligase family protein n=1 Tax=Ruminococcus flavefaciens TaxID=1265 RepID=UPI00046548D2|nr:O-antigen ligase family protein [Ruminococcus flavefaciens]